MFDPNYPTKAPSFLTGSAVIDYATFAAFLHADLRDFPTIVQLDRLESLYNVVVSAYDQGQRSCENPPTVVCLPVKDPIWTVGIASGSVIVDFKKEIMRSTPVEFVATIDI